MKRFGRKRDRGEERKGETSHLKWYFACYESITSDNPNFLILTDSLLSSVLYLWVSTCILLFHPGPFSGKVSPSLTLRVSAGLSFLLQLRLYSQKLGTQTHNGRRTPENPCFLFFAHFSSCFFFLESCPSFIQLLSLSL